jgi:integrase
MFLNNYRVNGKTIQNAEIYVHKHLAPFFGRMKAGQITTADVEAYKVKCQEEGAANGSINRELAALKRMFNLALQAERIVKKPHIPMLAEDNVRQGFFERWEFERVLAKVPDCLRLPFAFAYITGWRMKKEVLRLTWPQVGFETGLVRLEPGTTKNKKGRAFYFTADLRALLESQWQERITKYSDCPLVFHDHRPAHRQLCETLEARLPGVRFGG